jgi:hypothetical protein
MMIEREIGENPNEYKIKAALAKTAAMLLT